VYYSVLTYVYSHTPRIHIHTHTGLLAHDVNAATVFDTDANEYVGMLTVTDFLDILVQVSEVCVCVCVCERERECVCGYAHS
jgi:hypothetical protein